MVIFVRQEWREIETQELRQAEEETRRDDPFTILEAMMLILFFIISPKVLKSRP